MLNVSIWVSLAMEALACSGWLREVTHPAIPVRISAPAAKAANVVLRIWFLLDVNLRQGSFFHVRLHKCFPLGFGATFFVLKIAVKEANVSRPMKPAINSILWQIEQVNP